MDDRDQTRPAPDLVDQGVPATEEVRDEALHTGDPGVGDMPVPDRPWAAKDWGTTEWEQREGEPLGLKVARETQDREPGALPGERLLEDADDGLLDMEGDLVGQIDIGHSDMLSPEEAAITVRDDPGGLNYDDDPGYLDPSR